MMISSYEGIKNTVIPVTVVSTDQLANHVVRLTSLLPHQI